MAGTDKYDFSKVFDKALNRRIHEHLSVEVLNNTHENDLTQLVIDNIHVNNKRRSDGEIYSRLTRGQQIVYSTYILETQVFNGGFEGFYLNTHDELNEFVKEDLIVLQAQSHLDIVVKANEISRLINAGKADSSWLIPLNRELHALMEKDRLDAKRVKYIREHTNEFVSE